MRWLLGTLLTTVIAAAGESALAQAAPESGSFERRAVECIAALPVQQELAPLVGKVMLSSQGKATLEMQANPTKPTQADKTAISRWAVFSDECFGLTVAWMKEIDAPSWFRALAMQSKDGMDALVSSLYRGELTYGDFNVKHMALTADFRKRMDDATELADREQARAVKSQPEAPQQKKPDLAADLHQCEMEAARAYPVQMVQRMTSPGFQAPTQRTQQSTCSMVGNQVVCNSQPIGVDSSIYNRPPQYITEDVNQGRRQSAQRSCMLAKGYTPR